MRPFQARVRLAPAETARAVVRLIQFGPPLPAFYADMWDCQLSASDENQGEGVWAGDPECCTCFKSGSRHISPANRHVLL